MASDESRAEERSAIRRLRDDLQRPAGGWTVGFFTLLAVFISPAVVLAVGGPTWLGTGSMIAFLVAHMGWGAAGYYPRRIH